MIRNEGNKYNYDHHFCVFHHMEPRMQQRYLRIHLGGREGLLEEMRDTLVEISESIDPLDRVNQLCKYMDRLEKLDARLGPPPSQQVNVHVEGEVQHEHHITINRIVEEFQIVEGKSKVLEDGEEEE